MTKSIVGCTVNSNPPSIQFRLAADFRLSSARAVLVDRSTATPNGGGPGGALAIPLADWEVTECARVPSPPGVANAYDVQLRPVVAAPQYLPASGNLVNFEFRFRPGNKQPLEHLHAHAIVDYAGANVVGAINNATAAFTAKATDLNAEVQAARQSIDQDLNALNNQAQAANAGIQAAGHVINQQLADLNQEVQAAGDNVGAAGASINQELQFLTGFPFQVTDGVGSPPAATPGSGVTSSSGAVVAAQMRAVLGRSAGTGGVTGTLAALDRSFQLVEQSGVETWRWQPRSYAVQTDIGAGVTGKQASLARFASSISDEILPLVDGLTPLVPETAVNPDEIGATQAIFDDSLPKFVAEVATDGGPRYSRARGLLQDVATQLQVLGMLLGALGKQPPGVELSDPIHWPLVGFPQPQPQPPVVVQRPFEALDSRTWWPPSEYYVVTVDDEKNLTNYRIAFDRIAVLVTQFSAIYDAGAQPVDRGTLIVLLQRALDWAAQTAQAAYDALDSVNLRDLDWIIADPATRLTVEDVLSWATSFPTEEAPQLLQDGGKLGARSIETRAASLQAAVNAVKGLQEPAGMTHPRVDYALRLLVTALQGVVDRAAPLT